LNALGMLRRQISAITAWQVSALTGLALLAGLPLGVAAGRLSWALFGYDLGIPPGTITPTLALMVMTPTVIVIANAVAFWPGRTAARLSPADVLRAE
ncbi:MAG TPA: FtsX-like permease family protein, partial [Kutzneria sp.]|nr:FtsX-like permease family protein [Kutzneria sp.]